MPLDDRDWGATEAGSRFRYRAPIDPNGPFDLEPKPVGDKFDEALLQALSSMRRGISATAVFLERDEDGGYGDSARLFLTKPQCVLVVGPSPLAEKVRGGLRSGRLGSWRLHDLPAVQTSIQVLEPQLRGRFYNLLTRNEISTVEEAGTIPDEGWLELRNVGFAFLRALKDALAAHRVGTDVEHPSGTPADLDARGKHIEAQLHPATLARYRKFCNGLIQSRIPLTATDKITQALNAEPIPPADPMTILLLETAGERQLLDFYVRTHAVELTEESQ